MSYEQLAARVHRAGEEALAEKSYVAPVDLLVRMGWLAPVRVDEWRQGRLPPLERGVQANLSKLTMAMGLLRRWAEERGLQPSETDYEARTRDRRRLQFSVSGTPAVERAYRTHWVSPELSEAKRRRLAEASSKPPELVVINAVGDWSCTECSGSGDLLMMEEPGPLCMTCADLEHLVFLPRGDAALTRRAKKASSLSAVVVRFSKARGRYERQGVLVEEAALGRAEAECLADEEARLRRRVRDEERRSGLEEVHRDALAEAILAAYPGCPVDRARSIATQTAERGSGRVGRSSAGRALDPEAVRRAVVASVRHQDTRYDKLLMSGIDRAEARSLVREDVERVVDGWRSVAVRFLDEGP
jgi:hypothetical protein